jgi:four helix bundle protein
VEGGARGCAEHTGVLDRVQAFAALFARCFAPLAAWTRPATRRFDSGVSHTEVPMLRLYPFVLETLTVLRPLASRISRADADLGRQLRRAQASIALNLAEGAYSRGRNRQARYHTALGSARETLACLEVAAALGHTGAVAPDVQARFDRIIGTLVRLAGSG